MQTSQDRYINETAKRKGLKLQIVPNGYAVFLPSGNFFVLKTKNELQSWLRDY